MYCPILTKSEISRQMSPTSNFMKILPVGAALIHAERRTEQHGEDNRCFWRLNVNLRKKVLRREHPVSLHISLQRSGIMTGKKYAYSSDYCFQLRLTLNYGTHRETDRQTEKQEHMLVMWQVTTVLTRVITHARHMVNTAKVIFYCVQVQAIQINAVILLNTLPIIRSP